MPRVRYVGGPLGGRSEELPDTPEVGFRRIELPAAADTRGFYRGDPVRQGETPPPVTTLTWHPLD